MLPLYSHPDAEPAAWAAAASLGPDATVVVRRGPGPAGPGPAGRHDGGSASAAPEHRRDAGFAAATAALSAAGVRLLGHVDLAHATRPLAALLADVRRWAVYPVDGIFFDRAPTDAFSAGPVALALRVARRARLPHATLNPGVPPEPLYRGLGAGICVFEGDWADYVRWSGEGAWPGDGHLVYGVPPAEEARARRLAAIRGAGFGLVTERRAPPAGPGSSTGVVDFADRPPVVPGYRDA